MDPYKSVRQGITPQVAWCMFDWANSAFPTVIVTFVFGTYFATSVASNSVEGASLWGSALAISGVIVAILGPLMGSIADRMMRRKVWLAAFSMICIISTGCLWFVKPDPDWIIFGLILFVVANVAFEVGGVFYNSLLPGVTSRSNLGRLSGWGWGLGYAGGLFALLVSLVFFVQPPVPLFELSRQTAENVRAVGPFVAIWFGLFCLPLFLFLKESTHNRKRLSVTVMGEGLVALSNTIGGLHRKKNLSKFLAARLFYCDGLNTLFAFGGIYAAGTFGMELDEVLWFGIAMNVAAGLGALVFSAADDKFGSKLTVIIGLASIILIAGLLVLVSSVYLFWAFALILGVFVGPVQAASRTMMAHFAKPEQAAEMFGLFALSGKITSFLGPAVLAFVTLSFDSQRIGMATILIFLLVGLVILSRVKIPRP